MCVRWWVSRGAVVFGWGVEFVPVDAGAVSHRDPGRLPCTQRAAFLGFPVERLDSTNVNRCPRGCVCRSSGAPWRDAGAGRRRCRLLSGFSDRGTPCGTGSAASASGARPCAAPSLSPSAPPLTLPPPVPNSADCAPSQTVRGDAPFCGSSRRTLEPTDTESHLTGQVTRWPR